MKGKTHPLTCMSNSRRYGEAPGSRLTLPLACRLERCTGDSPLPCAWSIAAPYMCQFLCNLRFHGLPMLLASNAWKLLLCIYPQSMDMPVTGQWELWPSPTSTPCRALSWAAGVPHLPWTTGQIYYMLLQIRSRRGGGGGVVQHYWP